MNDSIEYLYPNIIIDYVRRLILEHEVTSCAEGNGCGSIQWHAQSAAGYEAYSLHCGHVLFWTYFSITLLFDDALSHTAF